MGDPLTYTLRVNGTSFSNVRMPDAPEAEGLRREQSIPQRSSRTVYRNGHMQQSVTFRWVYRPQQPGNARIAETIVHVNNHTYRTAPIHIQVLKNKAQSSPGTKTTTQEKTDRKGLFIRAEPTSQHIYRGEQTTLTYRLYFRPGYQVRRSRMAGSWDAQGFWREDLKVDRRPVPTMTMLDGKRYKSIVLKRAAVFPTRAGSLKIDPLRIKTEVQAPKHSKSLFDRFFSLSGDFDQVKLASPAVPMKVRPLPGDAPDSFYGAVGSFDMKATVDRRAVEVGEPVKITVQIRGTGNLSTLAAPPIQWPDAFDVYDPDVSTEWDQNERRLGGKKTFQFVIVPDEAGTFELPTVRFSYFSPENEQYLTLSKELPNVMIKGVPATANRDTEQKAMPNHDIADLMEKPGTATLSQQKPLYRNPWTYAALGLPLLALLGLIGYKRRQDRRHEHPTYTRRRNALPAARKQLKKARQILENGDQRSFFAALQHALLMYLGRRLDLPERGLTRDQLDHHLKAAGVPGRLRRKVRQLLEQTDEARFAPAVSDKTKRRALLKRMQSLIEELNKPLST